MLRRFQQACLLSKIMVHIEGSCRHTSGARPVRLHPSGCLPVVRKILTYVFPISTCTYFLPFACQLRVSLAQRISTVAGAKKRAASMFSPEDSGSR